MPARIAAASCCDVASVPVGVPVGVVGALGDTTTLADPAVVAELARRGKEEAAKEES